MSESSDYTPRLWKGHDFASARARYDVHAGRSYGDAKAKGVTAVDRLPATITTDSTAPLIIICDQTGSMGEWPKIVFSKLPYLFNEAHDIYLGPDVQISFGATGDARNREDYPIQARPFAGKDQALARLEELVIEGKGGGSYHETYELTALYYARNVHTPRAARLPVLIMIGDEACYSSVTPALAAQAHVVLQDDLDAVAIFQELQQRYSPYLILKPYQMGGSDKATEIYQDWQQYLPIERIAKLADPTRVVDTIFGILAQETDQIDYFRKEIEARQKPAQVKEVYEALNTIHAVSAAPKAPKALKSGHSTMFNRGGGKSKKSGDLL